MRRFIASSTAVLLLLLGTQAVLAQYNVVGPLTLSDTSVTGGDNVTASGDGFAQTTPVQVIIESDPVLLATVTTDANGSFSTVVTVPASFVGNHLIYATGLDPNGSVRSLATEIVVAATTLPRTSTVLPTGKRSAASDPLVLAGAGAAIVLMTGGLMLATRRRRADK